MKKTCLLIFSSLFVLGAAAIGVTGGNKTVVRADTATETDGSGDDCTNYYHTNGGNCADNGTYSTDIHSTDSSRSLKFHFDAAGETYASGDVFIGDKNGWNTIDLTDGQIEYDIKPVNVTTWHGFLLSDNNTVSGTTYVGFGSSGTGWSCTAMSDGWYHTVIDLSAISKTDCQETFIANAFRVRLMFSNVNQDYTAETAIYVDNMHYKTADQLKYWTKSGGFNTELLENYDTVTLSDVAGVTTCGGVDYTTDSTMKYTKSAKNTTGSVVYKFKQTINYQNNGKTANWRLRKAGWEGIEIWHTDNQYKSVQMRTANYNDSTYMTAFAEEWGGASKFVSGTTYSITLGAIDIKGTSSVYVFYIVDGEMYLDGTFDKTDSSYSYATDYSENVVAYRASSSLSITIEDDDSGKVDHFTDLYMHMDDVSVSAVTDTGACKGDTGYYALAKAAIQNLTDSQRVLFATGSAYANAYARIQAWASANGETFSINTSTGAVTTARVSMTPVIVSGNNTAVIVTIASLVSVLALAGFFLLKKKHN